MTLSLLCMNIQISNSSFTSICLLLYVYIPLYLKSRYKKCIKNLNDEYDTFFWRRKWQPTPVCLPGKSHGWSSLAGYSPWGLKESEMTELLHFHFSWYIFKIKLKKIQYYAAIVNDACEDKLFMLNEKASITVIFRNPINYKYASVCPVKKKRLERNSTAECQEIL